MLILVGVTINYTLNGGITTKAKQASSGAQVEADKETLMMAALGTIDNNGNLDLASMETPGGFTKVSTGKYTKGDYTYTINATTGAVTASNGTSNDANSLVALYKSGDLHIGDYVAYSPVTESSSYTVAGTTAGYNPNDYNDQTAPSQTINRENLTWRVMGLDEDDNLLLVSSTPTNAMLEFYGHVGYNNYETVLNNVCSNLYANTSLGISARSINLDDVETLVGSTVVNNAKANYCRDSSNHAYGYIGYTASFENAYIPTNWSATNTITNIEHTGYSFEIDDDDSAINETSRDLLVHIGNIHYYYYVASRPVDVTNSKVEWNAWSVKWDGFEQDIFCESDGYEDSPDENCLRPVIVIPSSVTTDDVEILESGTLYNWTNPLNMGVSSGSGSSS